MLLNINFDIRNLNLFLYNRQNGSYNDTLIVIITSTNNLQKMLDESCFGYLIYKDHKVIIRDQLIDAFF